MVGSAFLNSSSLIKCPWATPWDWTGVCLDSKLKPYLGEFSSSLSSPSLDTESTTRWSSDGVAFGRWTKQLFNQVLAWVYLRTIPWFLAKWASFRPFKVHNGFCTDSLTDLGPSWNLKCVTWWHLWHSKTFMLMQVAWHPPCVYTKATAIRQLRSCKPMGECSCYCPRISIIPISSGSSSSQCWWFIVASEICNVLQHLHSVTTLVLISSLRHAFDHFGWKATVPGLLPKTAHNQQRRHHCPLLDAAVLWMGSFATTCSKLVKLCSACADWRAMKTT
jgi:hypothetical protein